MTIFILLVLGLLLLVIGGELLVRGAVAIAQIARVTPAVIGLTIVAVGTSLPELAVTAFARFSDLPDVAMGNIIGSNIFNLAVVLGVASLLVPLRVHGNALKLEWPFMFISSFAVLLVARDGVVDRLEGGFFVISLILFTLYSIRAARKEARGREADHPKTELLTAPLRKWRSTVLNTGLVITGIAGLTLGARFLVIAAVDLAEMIGMSERVVGLTIVAAGTGLPEIATSIVAVLRKQTEIAIANVMGSNIFNILGTVGLVSLIKPTEVAPELISSDMWWMMGFSLTVLPMMVIGFRILRKEGILLLLGYSVYLFLLI